MGRWRIDKKELKRLVELRFSQRQIARRFGCAHSAVYAMCKRLKIKTTARPGGWRGPGLPAGTLAYLRERGRVAAARMGWPQARTASEAALLRALFARREATLKELMGREPRSLDRHNARALAARGLVVRRRVSRATGWVYVYTLAPDVHPPEPAHGRGR